MRTLGLLLCFACYGLPEASALQPADADRVFELWAARQQLPAARYELRWETFSSPARPGDPKPGVDGLYSGTGLVVLDPAGGRTRVDQDERIPMQTRPLVIGRARQTFRFDGREQSASLNAQPVTSAADDPDGVRVFVGPWGEVTRWPDRFAPLAWAHGLVVPAGGAQVGPFPTGWGPTTDRFRPAGNEVIDGRPCVMFLDTTAADGVTATVAVDAADGAVGRSRRSQQDGTTQTVTLSYRDTPHGRFPAGWEVATSRPGQPPAVENVVTVTAVRFDPPTAGDFRVALRPGMFLERDGRAWRVGPDGELLPVPAAERQPSALTRAAAMLGPVGLVGLLAAACLVAWLRVIRRRARATAVA